MGINTSITKENSTMATPRKFLFLITRAPRSEEHTSELQSPCNLVCRLRLAKIYREVPSSAGMGPLETSELFKQQLRSSSQLNRNLEVQKPSIALLYYFFFLHRAPPNSYTFPPPPPHQA